MSGERIELDPASMLAGSRQAGVLAAAAEELAVRLAGLPIPEGTPPQVAGEIGNVAVQMDRSSRSLAAQGRFLAARAMLGRLADGPLGSLLGLLSPPLLSPFEVPVLPPSTTPTADDGDDDGGGFSAG